MEALTDAYRQSLKLTSSDILSLDQHVQHLNGLPATGQTQHYRSSSLSSDPYWQRKRDSRKSSLLQKNVITLAEDDMVPSTGMTRSGVQPGTYIAAIQASDRVEPYKEETQLKVASRPDSCLDIQVLTQHGTGVPLKSLQYDGDNIQTAAIQGAESSRQQQSRQGSTVRFALSDKEVLGHTANDANISEVRPHQLPIHSPLSLS